jgi:hypothetical protein
MAMAGFDSVFYLMRWHGALAVGIAQESRFRPGTRWRGPLAE